VSIHVTQIGKHRFMCGLFWQSLSQPRDLVKEAAELARKISCDLMVLRRDHATAQAGFALSSEGARRGVLSLAAIVARTLSQEGAFYDGEKQPAHNWLGAFPLPDGQWAYFAMRDANFLPNGDMAGSKEEVLERLHSDYSLGGWNIVIGDAALEQFGFHNFMARRLEDMLPRSRGGRLALDHIFALRTVGPRLKPWQIFMSVSGVLLVAGGGWYGWGYYQQLQEQERQRLAEEQARWQAAQRALHPWKIKALPQDVAQTCLRKFGLLSPGGWALSDFACNATQVSYNWNRNGSIPSFLLEKVPAASLDLAGENASWSEPVNMPATRRDEALLPLNQLLPPLLSRLQLLQLAPKITLLPVAPVPLAPGADPASAVVPLRPEWQGYAFTLNGGGVPPLEIATLLSKPGVRLDRLSYRNGVWTMEGVIYVK
jgi:hypothetical protein